MMWESFKSLSKFLLGFYIRFYSCTERILFNQICNYLICTSLLCYIVCNQGRKKPRSYCLSGGVVASWLVRLSPDGAVRVQALTGDIIMCSWPPLPEMIGISTIPGGVWSFMESASATALVPTAGFTAPSWL